MKTYLTIAFCFSFIACFSQATYVKTIFPLKVVYANDIVYAPNGDCIFTQIVKQTDTSQNHKLYSIRLNKNGKTLWEKVYDLSSFRASLNYMRTLATSDNGLLVFTKAYDLDLQKQTSLLLKTDSVGNIQWSKTAFAISGFFEISPKSMIEDAQGNYVLLYNLRKTTNIFEDHKLQITKLNTSGDIIFQTGLEHLYNAGTYQYFNPSSITEMQGGGYAITLSYDCSECQDGPKSYLLYTNKSGGIVSYMRYGPALRIYGENHYPRAFVKKGSLHYMLGIMQLYVNNDWIYNYYSIAINPDGSPLACTLIPYDTLALQKYVRENKLPLSKFPGLVFTKKLRFD